MNKMWNVRVDDKAYCISLKGYNILVNEESSKLKNCISKKGLFQNEYEIVAGSKKALLVMSSLIGGTKLIIDGKDCATGEDYIPLKIPKWSYVFIALQLLNILNGLLGAVIAIVGCSITASISSNPKLNVFVKVLLNITILILAYVLLFAIVFALN